MELRTARKTQITAMCIIYSSVLSSLRHNSPHIGGPLNWVSKPPIQTNSSMSDNPNT
uniref:Uncharacterized protein n=1 Tax=Arundo donax TaxID=35708 RepID=A0A0A8YPU7_ARUDO